jgi:hypothetical protein
MRSYASETNRYNEKRIATTADSSFCLLPLVACLADRKMIGFLNLPSNLELDLVLSVQPVKVQMILLV